jgi:hypothetical protein
MLHRTVRVVLGASLLTACGQIVVPYGDGSVPGDAFGHDATPLWDTRPGSDVQMAPDAQLRDVTPTPDTPAFFDIAPPRDVPPGVDAIFPTDAPPPFDVAPGSIAGVYRAVRYEATDASGMRLMFTDTNTTVSSSGVSYDVRVNGMLFLTDNRLAESFGVLINDHFYADDNAMDVTTAFSSYGATIPGALRGTSFTYFTTTVNFEVNADGTISQRDDMAGSRITWSRTFYSARSGIMVQGQAMLWHAMTSAPFAAPRVALAWDRPGISTGVVTTNDSPIAFGPLHTALYDFLVPNPPMTAVASLGGTAIALGYPIVYDDTNGNGQYDPGSDVLRGVSNVAIAWRSGGASTAFLRSGFSDILEGLQMVLVHPDYTGARQGVTPWDPTNATPPDVAVATGPSPTPIPDVVR